MWSLSHRRPPKIPFRELFILLYLCGNCLFSPRQLTAPLHFPWPPNTDQQLPLMVCRPCTSYTLLSSAEEQLEEDIGARELVFQWLRSHLPPFPCSTPFRFQKLQTQRTLIWYQDCCNFFFLPWSRSFPSPGSLGCPAWLLHSIFLCYCWLHFFLFSSLGPSFRLSALKVVWLHSLFLCKTHPGTFLLHPSRNHPFLPE